MTKPRVILDTHLGALEAQVIQALAHHHWVSLDVGLVAAGRPAAVAGVGLVVLGVRAERESTLMEVAGLLGDRFPAISVFAVCERSDRLTHFFHHFARAGFDEVFELDLPSDRIALAEDVRSRLASWVSEEAILPVLERAARSERLLPVVRWCLRAGDAHHTVEEAAARFAWDRKTFYEDCVREGLGSIALLLAHGRYLRAAALHQRGLSYQQIAERLRYDTPSAVWNVLRRGRVRWTPVRGDGPQ